MTKKDRRRQSNRRRTRKPLLGSWEIHYECGAVKRIPPANQNEVTEKAKKLRHKCDRESCRPWLYLRKVEDA